MIFQHLQRLSFGFSPRVPGWCTGRYRKLVVVLVLVAGLANSALASELARSEAELQALNTRIEALQSRLAADKSEQASLTDELDRIERRLSRLDKAMRQNQQSKASLEDKLDNLERESRQLQGAKADATQRLGALLRSGYLLGQQSGLRMLVNQQDPHSAARRMAMFRYVIEARNAQLAEIAAFIARVAANRQQIIASTAELEQTRAALEAGERQLEQDKQARAEQVALLKKAMQEDEKQLNLYTRRQQRLEKLLVELRRPKKPIISEPPAAPNPVASQKQPVAAVEPSSTRTKSRVAPASRPSDRQAQSPAKGNQLRQAARQSANKPGAAQSAPETDRQVARLPGGFADNKGALPPPLRASIEARFGEARLDSGLSWQGVLFGASSGQAVKVVYPGQVVFADWFRGYGKLMVVDHGDGYMSLYGHNQSLNARVGDSVSAGQVIARANDAAGVPVPGLYFEIRHNGTPDDPLQWIR